MKPTTAEITQISHPARRSVSKRTAGGLIALALGAGILAGSAIGSTHKSVPEAAAPVAQPAAALTATTGACSAGMTLVDSISGQPVDPGTGTLVWQDFYWSTPDGGVDSRRAWEMGPVTHEQGADCEVGATEATATVKLTGEIPGYRPNFQFFRASSEVPRQIALDPARSQEDLLVLEIDIRIDGLKSLEMAPVGNFSEGSWITDIGGGTQALAKDFATSTWDAGDGITLTMTPRMSDSGPMVTLTDEAGTSLPVVWTTDEDTGLVTSIKAVIGETF